MKIKLLLSLAIAALVTSSVFGQTGTSGTTFSFTPVAQNVTAGGMFNVTISLTGTTPPANITAYDLYLVTSSANSGLFTITMSTPSSPFNGFGPTLGTGDTLNAPAASGFVRNNIDLGYSAATAQSPPYAFTLQTLQINVSPSTAAGTYTFFTSTVANAGGFYSDVSDSVGGIYTVGQGSFQVTVAAVPEPATWSLVGLGGLGFVGLTMLRRRTS